MANQHHRRRDVPLTAIDAKTALIVIDLQKGIAGAPLLRPLHEVVTQVNLLIDAFHAHGLPVIFVVVDGIAPGRTEEPRRGPREVPAGFADLLPDLRCKPDDHLVTKKTPGAFTRTGLEDYLKGLGVTQVVIAGVATASGVESSARQAYESGFHVTLATDAMSDTSEEAQDYSLRRIMPRLGESGTTQDIIAVLERGRGLKLGV
jgi:nicotinamidase-related amidase